jgi:formamidopyrimidine-DNA glycosylase
MSGAVGRVDLLLAAGLRIFTRMVSRAMTRLTIRQRHKRVESGYFDRSLAVYGREGLPCPRCQTLIVREKFTNRSSFYCPRCQPAPE